MGLAGVFESSIPDGFRAESLDCGTIATGTAIVAAPTTADNPYLSADPTEPKAHGSSVVDFLPSDERGPASGAGEQD